METTPDSAPAPARRLRLRLLICNPRSYGPKNIFCKGRVGTPPRTREDPFLPQYFSYECKSQAEWLMLAEGISKQLTNQNSFFATAQIVNDAVGATPAARLPLEPGPFQAEQAATPATTAAQFTLDCLKATVAAYAGKPATPENLQECLDRMANVLRGIDVPTPPAVPESANTEVGPPEIPQTAEASQSGSGDEPLSEAEATPSETHDQESPESVLVVPPSGGSESVPPVPAPAQAGTTAPEDDDDGSANTADHPAPEAPVLPPEPAQASKAPPAKKAGRPHKKKK
ncbi:MAG: hypothetical protein R3F13_13220 [Prosthecobacter sp.]